MKKEHSITLLFPIFLFFLFSFCALVILLLSARSYRSTVEQSLRGDDAGLSLAYLSEKLHQSDRAGAVSLEEFQEIPAISLENGEDFVTYLYFHDGALRELLTRRDAPVGPEAGQAIFPLEDLHITLLTPTLFYLTARDDSHESEILLGLRTDQEVPHG